MIYKKLENINYARQDLYVTLGAETKAEQTSVRMAVRKAKASGVLTKTQTLGVYAVK